MPSEELKEPTVLQVVFDDDIGDSIKDKLHILGISGTSEMGVDLLGVLSLVQLLKLVLNIACSFIIFVGP